MKLRVEINRPGALDAADRDAWARAAARRPLVTVFCTPEWAEAAEAAGLPARVAIARNQQDEPLGFLAFQKTGFGGVRPLGAPMCDVQGISWCEGVPADETAFLQRLLGVYQFTGWSGKEATLESASAERYAIIDIAGGYDVWLEAQRATHKKAFNNLRNRENRLAREVSEVVFTMDAQDDAAFAQVISWKRAQMLRSGHPDLFARDWPLALLNALGEIKGAVRPLVSTLYFDGRLAAAHIGAVVHGVLHHWFPAYEPDFHKLAPGHLLLLRMLEACAEHGIGRVDLATGDYPYKEHFATRYETVYAGASHALLESENLVGRAIRKIDRFSQYAGR